MGQVIKVNFRKKAKPTPAHRDNTPYCGCSELPYGNCPICRPPASGFSLIMWTTFVFAISFAGFYIVMAVK